MDNKRQERKIIIHFKPKYNLCIGNGCNVFCVLLHVRGLMELDTKGDGIMKKMKQMLVYGVALLFLFIGTGMGHAKVLKVKAGVGTGGVPGNMQYEYVNKFGELLQAYAGDKVKWELYPGGQLGSEQEQYQSCRLGSQNVFSGAVANFTPFCEPLFALMFPGLFKSVEDANQSVDRSLDEINKLAVKHAGVRIIGWVASASRTLLNSKKPIYVMADARDLKWRSAKNPIYIETFKSWGINPIPTPWSEAYSGLKTGVIDGDYNPNWCHWTCSTWEHCKYICDPGCNFHMSALVIGERFFQKLSKELQDAVIRAGKEATLWERAWIKNNLLKRSEDGLKKNGIVTTELKDREKWQEAVKTIWPKFYDQIGEEGKRILEIVQK